MPFDLKDITGLGGVLEKLIDVTAKAVGTLYKPVSIILEGTAEAKRIKLIANAVADTQDKVGTIEYSPGDTKIKSIEPKSITPDMSLAERVEVRNNYQESKRQQNIETIVAQTANILVDDKATASNEPVSEDWANRFFNYAQDVNNEEIQRLWARVLAGEVKQPKSFSLRTLDVIRNLSQDEAEAFTRVAQLRVYHKAQVFIHNPILGTFRPTEYFSLDDFLLMLDIGLVQTVTALEHRFSTKEKLEIIDDFDFGSHVVSVTHTGTNSHYTFPILNFTKVGEELLQLVDAKPDLGYIKGFVSALERNETKVKIAQIMERRPEEFIITDWVDSMEFRKSS